MSKIKPIILPVILSVIVLSMVISPTYPTLIAAYAVEVPPVLNKKCDLSLPPDEPISPDCELLNLIIAEEAARIAADNVLQGNIDAEEAARILADGILQGNIDAEEAARIAEDNLLKNRVTSLETRVTDVEDMGNEAIDQTIIALEAATIIFAAGALACTANLVPACAVAFGALDILAVATILILENIEF